MELLDKFMRLSGCTDGVLASVLLDQAEDYILTETNRTVLPSRLVTEQINIALISYNRLGMEGEASRNEGGVSISINDIPEHTKNVISLYRLARVGGKAHEKSQD
ncbi:MAG: phage head-tail adapter protein [Lachnospiraceae bacterium]|nr:phage head-tail adapter protein [Lachnospiraceae bacterium]